MKASAFRRWPVAGAYSPEQTTRLTGGSDSIVQFLYVYRKIKIDYYSMVSQRDFIFQDKWSSK